MSNALFVLLDDRGVLAIGGPDRRSFLQGLVSNDVAKISADQACYAALLTAQGKYLHDFMMAEIAVGAEHAIALDAEARRLADLKRRLSIYRLRAKVTLDERPDLAVAAVFGEVALAALALPDTPGRAREFASGIAYVDPRFAALGARCILPREGARSALTRLGLRETGFEEWDSLRLRLGIPDGSRDLELDKTILLEAGFDELNGVDWHKGCYMGQELTARTKYRGLVKRRLVPVTIDGPIPTPGTIVTAEGRDVGEMRSSREGHGLAVLRIDALDKRPLLAADAVVVPSRPSWLRLAETNQE